MISYNLVERLAGVEINFSEKRSEMTPISLSIVPEPDESFHSVPEVNLDSLNQHYPFFSLYLQVIDIAREGFDPSQGLLIFYCNTFAAVKQNTHDFSRYKQFIGC